MRSMIWTISGLLAVAALVVVAASQSIVTVQPEEQAVVIRNGEVRAVLDSGPHGVVPFLDTVAIYQTRIVRRVEFPEAFELAECPATVALQYNIGDVAAFYEAGAREGLSENAEAVVMQVLSDVSADPEILETMASTALRDRAAEMLRPGLIHVRVDVDTGDCGPQPVEVEMRLVPAPPIATVGELGRERSGAFSVRLITSDAARVDIEGLVATFDIADEDTMTACAGMVERIRLLVESLAAPTMRGWVGSRPLEALNEMPDAMRAASPDFEAECGVILRALDFEGATVRRLVLVE